MCRSRRELSNAYLLAKIGVDTAENEPLELGGKFQFNIHFTPYCEHGCQADLAVRPENGHNACSSNTGMTALTMFLVRLHQRRLRQPKTHQQSLCGGWQTNFQYYSDDRVIHYSIIVGGSTKLSSFSLTTVVFPPIFDTLRKPSPDHYKLSII